MPAFDMDQARVKTIKKLKKKLAKYQEIEIEKMVEEKWDEATDKIASQLATALAENEKLKNQKRTKKLPAGFVMIEEKSFDKVAKDLMKVSAEKKQLVEENKKLKEELLYYQFYKYTVGLLDSLTKEDVDNFTDSKVHRKTLYERIGYDD